MWRTLTISTAPNLLCGRFKDPHTNTTCKRSTNLALSPIDRPQILRKLLSQSEVHVEVLKRSDRLYLHVSSAYIMLDVFTWFQKADDFP